MTDLPTLKIPCMLSKFGKNGEFVLCGRDGEVCWDCVRIKEVVLAHAAAYQKQAKDAESEEMYSVHQVDYYEGVCNAILEIAGLTTKDLEAGK